MQRYLQDLQDADGDECAIDFDPEDGGYDSEGAEMGEGEHLEESPASTVAGEMHEIIPMLYIGDFMASQKFDHLKALGVTVVVAAMRQKYSVPDGITVHQVPIEDNSRTNVIAHFSRVNEIIADAHSRQQGVLVHCQAGVSRSTTLVAAFLMHEQGLTCDEAVEKISMRRSVVKPTEFFLHQLEMYERMGCEVDPANHSEYRRFLMNFHHESFMDGNEGETLYLAYYPSPATTPRSRSPSTSDPFGNLRMTPFEGVGGGFTPISRTASSSSRTRRLSAASSDRKLSMTSMSEQEQPVRRRRSSRLAEEQRESIKAEAQAVREGKATLLKVGQGRVVVKGKRIRCKLCNRELAARQHILEHEPGQGQQAFAPRRRDMNQHRQEMQRKREEEARRAERKLARLALSANASTASNAGDEPTKASNSERDNAKAAENGTLDSQSSKESEKLPDNQGTDHSRSALGNKLAERIPGVANLRVALPPPFRESTELRSSLHTVEGDSPSPAAVSPPLLPNAETCHSYFVEPLSWMQDQLADGELGGRILCPNQRCQSKLGSFDWAGLQCSCGSWVVPGFAIAASKVDEVG